MEKVGIIVAILFCIVFLGLLSGRYKFPFTIVLVLSGIAIGLIPGLPEITLSPDVVFLIFLPPLLYSAAWTTSWNEFKVAIVPIAWAAVGLVFLTTIVVAIVAHSIIPEIGWPLAFLIGAIVSPPDAIAATSITKGLGLSPRLMAILEGESLLNDASGLIAYKYALAAVLAGNFVLWQAGLNFLIVAAIGTGIGLVFAYIVFQIHKHFICDPVIEVTLTFLTPFAAYLIAEHFHFSGVLSVVSAGLYLSFRAPEMLTHQSRIMAYSAWEVIIYILNSLVFIFIGLQLRSVMEGISNDYTYGELATYGLAISLAVIGIRFIYVYPAVYIPRLLSKRIRSQGFDRKNLVIFGWSGMRGVVSMAAALALPTTMLDGTTFVHRDLVIFLTFCVILSTLLILGLSLPWVIRKLKIAPHTIVAEEFEVRTQVVGKVVSHIEENFSLVNDNVLRNIKNKYEIKYNRIQKTDLPANYFANGETLEGKVFYDFTRLQIELIRFERDYLHRLHKNGASEEIMRKMERELDLEEARLQMDMLS